MLSTLFILNFAAATAFGSCQTDFVPEMPRFRSALIRNNLLSEAEAWTAELRWVVINYETPNVLRKLARLNRTKEAKGFIMIDSRARALVFLKNEDPQVGHRIFKAADHPEATVWQGQKRILRSVQGEWQWEQRPPPRREVSEISLAKFLTDYESVLRKMLNAGQITEHDIADGVIQETAPLWSERYVVLASGERVFAFSQGSSPRWVEDFVQKFNFGTAVEVGRSGRRLYQKYTPAKEPTGEFGWTRPAGLAEDLLPRVEDPEWREFLKTTEVDTLAMHPLVADLERLEEAKMVRGRVGEDVAHVVLIPNFGAGVKTEDPIPYRVNAWLTPGDLSPSEIIELEDGRRIGVEPDRSAFRWLPREDAFSKLLEFAQTRGGRRQ